MKLVRYGAPGAEKPGMIDAEGALRDLSGHLHDIDATTVTKESLATLRALDPGSLPLVQGTPRFGACVGSVPNFYCVGLNYVNHAKESGLDVPKEPVLFSKATSCIQGPNDDVTIPKGSEKSDWEVELGVVIGAVTEHVSEADALSHVAGYCLVNDLSERAFQTERGGQWIKGKSAPTFGPIGPWLVTADDVPDPQALSLWLKINGQTMQNSNTSDMIFSVATIVSYMSKFMRLLPGDVITTGTPEGVGMGKKPPRYLTDGDQIQLSVEGLGTQNQNVHAFGH